MTQLEQARNGIITTAMKYVAKCEGIDPEVIRCDVAQGHTVIPANVNHKGLRPKGIGRNLSIKVNSNIGTSSDYTDLNQELEKLKASIEVGADTVMDLSTGGNLDHIRKTLIKHAAIPFGTVPIYQAAIEAVKKKGGIVHMTEDGIFKVIERQAKNGVDFMTVHCGVTLYSLDKLKRQGRLTDIVSRGGAFLTTWMIYNKKENPLYQYYDRLLEIACKYDVTLSLGDGLRPGCLADATDRAQVQELLLLGELTERAWEKGVQVMIEGPGHMPMNQIEANVLLEKKVCKGAPFYVLGPLTTDIASGYDHIAGAIGGAIAGMAGADFLCYVTPAEHLKLPSVQDVREGVIAARIAAHAADIAKGNKRAMEKDNKMSKARKKLDWEKQISLSIDPDKARLYRSQSQPKTKDVCTMCGEFCAIKLVKAYFKRK